MKTNASDLAFGNVTYHTMDGGGMENGTLTKREYFAAMAMQGALSVNANPNVKQYEWDKMAKDSVELADALISALNE